MLNFACSAGYLPLTLTLSLREREQQASDWYLADGRWANSGAGVIERRWTFLPLPRGEGRGQGEPSVAHPTVQSVANGARLWSQTQPQHVALAGSVGDFGRAAAGALHTYLFSVSPNFSLSPRGTTGGRVGEGGVRALLGDAPPLPVPLLPQGRRGRRDKGESLNRYSHTAAIQRIGGAVRCFVITAFLAVALLAGCAVGPDYHRPAALVANPMPAAFGDAAISNASKWKTAEPSAHLARGDWWEMYDDPELDQIGRASCRERV